MPCRASRARSLAHAGIAVVQRLAQLRVDRDEASAAPLRRGARRPARHQPTGARRRRLAAVRRDNVDRHTDTATGGRRIVAQRADEMRGPLRRGCRIPREQRRMVRAALCRRGERRTGERAADCRERCAEPRQRRARPLRRGAAKAAMPQAMTQRTSAGAVAAARGAAAPMSTPAEQWNGNQKRGCSHATDRTALSA